jgi:hypothetical protein
VSGALSDDVSASLEGLNLIKEEDQTAIRRLTRANPAAADPLLKRDAMHTQPAARLREADLGGNGVVHVAVVHPAGGFRIACRSV